MPIGWSNALSLNCTVVGATHHIFQVEIASTDTASTLIKVIKNEKSSEVCNIDDDDLALYDISLPINAQLEPDILKGVLGSKDPLQPTIQLSAIFSAPLHQQLHIIVVVLSELRVIFPELITLNCLVHSYDDPLRRIFSITIDKNKRVFDLKVFVKNKKSPEFDHISVIQLWLYRASLPGNDEFQQQIDDPNLDPNLVGKEPLDPLQKLTEIFPRVPEKRYLHVIVRLPLPRQVVSLMEERATYLRKNSAETPLIGASLTKFSETQKNNVYLCHLPFEAHDPVPVTLLEPIFSQFVDDCRAYKPTGEDSRFVHELSRQMSRSYFSVKERMEMFRSLFSSYTATAGSTQFITDGYLVAGKFLVAIAVGTNEMGTDNNDPFAQGLIHYHQFIEQLDNSTDNVTGLRSVLPCFHIVVFGACVGIAGSAFTTKIQYDALVPIIPLFCHPTNDMQEMAARTFGALKIALEKLKDMYSKPILCLESPTWSPACPYRRYYTDSNNNSQTFTYSMKQDFRNNLVFFGKTDCGVPICIKFVRRYSPEVHRFCARKGHAPELIAYEKLPGAWYMVVMGALDIYPNSPTGSYRHFIPHIYPSLDLKSLEEAVTALIDDLHNEGYVHGDLRDVNLFVRHDAQDKTKDFMLIDFDWAGEVHKTRYPRLVNREMVRRPSGAQDGMEILKDHDLEMLHFLFHPYD